MVLKLAQQGRSPREIAAQSGITTQAVYQHLSALRSSCLGRASRGGRRVIQIAVEKRGDGYYVFTDGALVAVYAQQRAAERFALGRVLSTAATRTDEIELSISHGQFRIVPIVEAVA